MSKKATVRWVAVKSEQDGANVAHVELQPGEQVLSIEPGDMGFMYVYIAQHIDWTVRSRTSARGPRNTGPTLAKAKP